MNFKTTAVLIVLLFALGGFVFLMKDRSPSYSDLEAQRKAAAEGVALFDADTFKATWADSLELNQNDKHAKVTLKNDEWRQIEPVHFSLSTVDVQGVLDTIAGLKYTDLFMPGQGEYPAADKIGLSPAAATITVAGTGDHVFSHQLKVGRSIVGGKLYVMRDQDPKVYVVADDLAKQLADKPVHRWRIMSLTAPSESQASSLTITGNDSSGTKTKLELNKKAGRWQLTSPDNGRVDRQAVASLLNAAQATKINEFVVDAPDNLATYGLATPVIEMTIISKLPGHGPDAASKVQTRTQTLKIGAPADLQNTAYFAVWTQEDQPGKPAVFTVGKETFERFTPSVDKLRDPALTPLAQGEIKQMSLAHGQSKVAFSRSAKGWDYDVPADGKSVGYLADDSSVSTLVAALTGSRATRFVPAVSTEAAPLTTVTLTGLGQASADVLRIWVVNEKDKDGKAQWLVLRDDEPVGRVVLADGLKSVLVPAWQFRDRELADLTASKINRIVIVQPGGRDVVLTRTVPTPVDQVTVQQPDGTKGATRDVAGPWKITGSETELVDPTLPGAIVAGMSPLRVAAWREPQESMITSLGSVPYDLTVSTSNGKTVHLKMGEEGHAQLDGQSQTFVLEAPLRDAIKASYGKSNDSEVSDATLNMTK